MPSELRRSFLLYPTGQGLLFPYVKPCSQVATKSFRLVEQSSCSPGLLPSETCAQERRIQIPHLGGIETLPVFEARSFGI